MSLIDFGVEAPFSVQEPAHLGMEVNPELTGFLEKLDRPIGKISPTMAEYFVISPFIHDEQQVALDSLVKASCLPRGRQDRELGLQLTVDKTPYGDQVISLLTCKTQVGFHRADNLIVVEDQFIFGHSHLFKYIKTHRDIPRVEHKVRPLQRTGVDRFNLIQRRAKQISHLLQTAS